MFAGLTVWLAAQWVLAQGLVEYQFTGVVTDNSGNLGVFGPFGTVQINDSFSGRFSYMTGPSNPDQEPGDSTLGVYNLVDFVLDQAVVAVTPFGIGVTHMPGLPQLDPMAPPDLGTDRFSVAATFLSGQDTKLVSLRLEAPYQAVFADDSLPTMLALSDFSDSQIVRAIRVLGLSPDGTSQIDEGHLTSLVRVPEPSSMLLVLLSLCSMSRMQFHNRWRSTR